MSEAGLQLGLILASCGLDKQPNHLLLTGWQENGTILALVMKISG